MTPAIDPSPAERYAASRVRAAHPAVTEFAGQYPFELDDFQVEACRSLEDGSSVLVCAPTGAGKTVVGEFAISLGLASGQKCYYTTPIKALSNQKYNDLVDRHGSDRVGLLTGDNSINAAAPVVVMTTEVLRNMLYVGSDALTGLGYVVMDEVHYLGDRFRGAVWEEVLIHLPDSVRLVALSATVSNAEEFGAWLVTVRGDTRVIVHEQRPVPLWQHVLVGSRLFDLFKDADPTSATVEGPADVNPELREYLSDRMRVWDVGTRGRVRRRGPGWRPPHRPDVVTRLDREGLLPLITFIFSRLGCDAAVRQCVLAGLWLTEPAERDEITALVEERTAGIPSEDLEVLGYWEWLDGLRRGGLEVLEDFEGAEVHAVGGIDAALEAGERVESILIGVAERGIVLDGGVDKIGVSEVFVQALYLIIPELRFDAAEAALNPLGGDEGVDEGEFGGAGRAVVELKCGS